MRLALIVFAIAAVGVALPPATAQEASCVTIENDAQRLACYDAANGRAPRAAPDLLGAEAEARDRLLPSFGSVFQRGEPAPDPAPVQLEVARVERRMGGQILLVMTNDETWSPAGSPDRLPRAGESVSIQRYAVGAYVLLPEHGEPFRVRKQN